MRLKDIIKARGKGAVNALLDEINLIENADFCRSTISRWIRNCRVEECGDIYWIGSNKFISNMNLTPEESRMCLENQQDLQQNC